MRVCTDRAWRWGALAVQVLLGAAPLAAAGWCRIGIGGVASFVVIAPSDPQVLYASYGPSIDTVIAKSVDGGKHFQSLKGGGFPEDAYSLAVAIDPVDSRILYVSVAGYDEGLGVAKSVDGGETWVLRSVGLTDLEIWSLAVAPRHRKTVYAGTRAGVFSSRNGGATWAQVLVSPKPGQDMVVSEIAINPQDSDVVFVGSLFQGLFRSEDGGRSWRQLGKGYFGASYDRSEIRGLVLDPSAPSTVYVSVEGKGVFRSLDAGQVWTRASAGLPRSSSGTLAIDPMDPEILYIGVDRAPSDVYMTQNGGFAWRPRPTGMAHAWTRTRVTVCPTAPSTVYAMTGQLLVTSGDRGSHWEASGLGLEGAYVSFLAAAPSASRQLFAGSQDMGVVRTRDNGKLWEGLSTGFGDASVRAVLTDPRQSRILYAMTSDRGAYTSGNSGKTWLPMNTGLSDFVRLNALLVDPADPDHLLANTIRGGFFESRAASRGWSLVGTDLLGLKVSGIVVDPRSPSTMYAATKEPARIYKTLDGGRSWRDSSSGLVGAGDSVNQVLLSSSSPPVLLAATSIGLFRSHDAGETWSRIGSGLPPGERIACLTQNPRTPSTLYAGAYGVFRSLDAGETWMPFNAGLPSGYFTVGALLFDPGRSNVLYAATADGVFERAVGGE